MIGLKRNFKKTMADHYSDINHNDKTFVASNRTKNFLKSYLNVVDN